MLYEPFSWKVTFPVTSKPTPPTVFNLQASDWVHCEEETGAYTQLSRNTYKLVSFFFCTNFWSYLFCPKTNTFIIIIKKCQRCKAEREWYTPYQSEDPSPTIPTYRQKEEKEKKVETIVWIEQRRPIKKHWPCSWNPPVPHHRIRG